MSSLERVVPHWYMYPPKTCYLQSEHFDYSDLRGQVTGDICLYIHIPFCNMKCSFCSLFTSSGYSEEAANQYVDYLVKEIADSLSLLADSEATVQCIYFGGGTPGLLEASAIDEICTALMAYPQAATATKSVEFSPDLVDEVRTEPWLRNDFDRISIGVQTFSDERLVAMGRKHSAEEALFCVEQASHFGFKEINVDLIFGHVDQTSEDWAHDLSAVIESQATSCTFHPLATVEKTAFERKLKRMSGEDSSFHSLQRQAYEHFERHCWVRTSAISYSKTGNANPLERAEALGANTIGFGAGSRTYLPSLHISTLPVQARAPFGGVLKAFYNSVELGKKPALASMPVSSQEALRRDLILQLHHGVIKWPSPAHEVDRFTLDAITAKLEDLEERELLVSQPDGFEVTYEGSLLAARLGAELSSLEVRRSVVHLTKENEMTSARLS